MKLRYVAASLSMFCFVGLAFWAYNKVVIEGDNSMTVPVIRSPEGPYKSPPEDPGGMDIPHQDTAIYDMLNEDREASDDDAAIVFKDQSEEENIVSDEAADGEGDIALLQKGFVLKPRQIDEAAAAEDDDEPKIERLFDETEDSIARAKQNIEAASIADKPSEALVSDDDITSLSENADSANPLEPEEVDAGIIIVDPMAKDDVVKAPAPTVKPGSKPSSSSTFEGVLDGVLTSGDSGISATDEIQPSMNEIEGLNRASAYASAKKPNVTRVTARPKLSLPSAASTSSQSVSALNGKTHYTQLASLPSRSRATQEWALLQARYPSILGRITVRYVDIDLGERGVYTRVQAGPYSEEDARETCAALAQAGKSSGCIVVKE